MRATGDDPDVLLSYPHEDLERCSQLRNLLWRKGWYVFRDDDLTPGTPRWDKLLEQKLAKAKCVIALWSANSSRSNVQFDEANFALSRGVLVNAKIDDVTLPLGLRSVQHVDLTNWEGEEAHPGIVRIFARVEELVNAANAKPVAIGAISRELSGRPDSADRHSVSNRGANLDAILDMLRDADEAVRNLIREGYEQLAEAHREARLTLNDEAPREHYKSAAVAFRQALLRLSSEALSRPVSGNMPVGYFLKMEFANALVFSVRDEESVPQEAIDIYEKVAVDYPNDTAVFLRLGRARVKAARYGQPGITMRETLQAAIRDLNKALTYAPFDDLVDPDHWVYFEAPLQIGVCFYLIGQFPDLSEPKRQESLSAAISHTEAVLKRKMPERDPDDFIRFITLRAAGNVLYFLGMLIRSGAAAEQHQATIDRQTQYLVRREAWAIVKNQTRIIDSIMFAASTIGNRTLALEMAKLNGENFRKIAHERPLQAEEKEMMVRAAETAFLVQTAPKALAETVYQLPPSDPPKALLSAPEKRRRLPVRSIVGAACMLLATSVGYVFIAYPEVISSFAKFFGLA